MSNLTEIVEAIAELGLPILGAALPVPGGAAIGAALAQAIGAPSAKPADILTTLSASADAVEKAKEFQAQHEETLLRITVDAEIREVESVNTTMQAEAAAEHWPTYSWRPFIGFCFGGTLLVTVLVVSIVFIVTLADASKLPLLDKLPPFISNMAFLLGVPMPILGIASWFRGKMQADPCVPSDNRG